MLITAGIIIFNLLENTKKLSSDTKPITVIGILLLVLSLFSDGMTSSKQSEARNKYKPGIFEMMESSNVYAIFIAVLYGIASMELLPTIEYLLANPECLTDLIVLTIMGTIGQCFVYFTIVNFNSFYLSVITTTRKFFTVISSILIYNHHISGYQWLSIILVFVGVGMELLEGKDGKHKGHHKVKHESHVHDGKKDKQNKTNAHEKEKEEKSVNGSGQPNNKGKNKKKTQ